MSLFRKRRGGSGCVRRIVGRIANSFTFTINAIVVVITIIIARRTPKGSKIDARCVCEETRGGGGIGGEPRGPQSLERVVVNPLPEGAPNRVRPEFRVQRDEAATRQSSHPPPHKTK